MGSKLTEGSLLAEPEIIAILLFLIIQRFPGPRLPCPHMMTDCHEIGYMFSLKELQLPIWHTEWPG